MTKKTQDQDLPRLPEGPTEAYDPNMTESQALKIVERLRKEGRLPTPQEVFAGLQRLNKLP